MSVVIINAFIYPLATTVILLSIFGYGKVINNFFYKDLLSYQFRNLILFQGLIFIGLFSIIVNFQLYTILKRNKVFISQEMLLPR